MEWYLSLPDSVRIGILFLVFSWVFFIITLPVIKSFLVWKWKLLEERECRRRQKMLFWVLVAVHCTVIPLVVFALDYANSHKWANDLLDQNMVYLYLVFSICIFLQIIYEAVSEHTKVFFGADPRTPLWYKAVKPIFKALGFVADFIVDSFKKIFDIK